MDLDNDKWSDINVVGSLLKHFFQKLHEPLITESEFCDSPPAACVLSNSKSKDLQHSVAIKKP